MLKKINRFQGNRALMSVVKKGQSTYDQNIKLKYIKNPNQANSKFAVVVSKKVSKSAVVRNKIRRRIYHSLKSEIDTNKGLFVIFIYSDNFKSIKFNQLQTIIEGLFYKSR